MSDMTHKTVPVEPTNEMFEAAREYYCKLHPNCGVWPCGEAMGIYAAMLAAAPPSPVTELEVMLAGSLRDLLSATESQVLSLSEMRTNARAALADVWSYSPELVREIVAAELRKAQEAEHAAPHAGVYQGLTDHIVGLIREDRKAQEGREPVAWRVRRSDGEHELFFHEPTAKQRAECFVPHSSAEPLYTSPPPNSDKARDAERYRWLLRNYLRFSLHDEALKHGSLDAAIDAALAAQQKGKK